MKLYIWEGNGISGAYHDDGTLVVLAESPEQARQLVRDEVAARKARYAEFERQRNAYFAERDPGESGHWTKTPRGAAIWAMLDDAHVSDLFDGRDEALDREPDRIVETDRPTWVAFNGGGYD